MLDKKAMQRIKQLKAERPLDELGQIEPGSQADGLMHVAEADPAKVTEIKNILGDAILNDRGKVEAILLSQSEVGDFSLKIFEGQIGIGRSIARLRDVLSKEEYRRLVEEAPRLYGAHLSRQTVGQLVTIADSLEGREKHKIDIDILPKHYSIAYLFAAMSTELYDRAKESGLVRPNVKRKEVQDWKRQIVEAEQTMRSRLRAELSRLDEQRETLIKKVRDIEKRMKEINQTLSATMLDLDDAEGEGDSPSSEARRSDEKIEETG